MDSGREQFENDIQVSVLVSLVEGDIFNIPEDIDMGGYDFGKIYGWLCVYNLRCL